ncbi:hypothetical protein K2173_000594 [Erythroxylum novogranatense]|uniref:Enoyl reductase (ER) domain-containing protein n=1 Tax=Erythroxylum novogranatense TaxID=1862640 RepID=A0AAV8S817_9ROSI|nr:hypothetical protein K2173_000594 [Erythroxylum novogranatense]
MATKLMHALIYDRYGGGAAALKYVQVPIPIVKKDEILVKIEAASLNPLDWKLQSGIARPFSPRRFPHIPGGLAEYAVAKEKLTVVRPSEISAAEGAGLPIAGLTAYKALTQCAGLNLDGTGEHMNILITAASGGVGHYAVQLARLGNAHITATCGTRNIELVKSLGADEVLDYKSPDGAALKSPSGRKYDAVLHCATGIPWSSFEPNLSENGKVIDITPGPSTFVTFVLNKLTFSRKQIVPMILTPRGEDLAQFVKLVKEKKLQTVIDSTYPLSKAGDAWAKSMDGHATGKIIVQAYK